jgi:putative DNA-invertase from lambdoid prophage Rac
MKCAIYGRVSTEHQDFGHQVEELRAYAVRQEWQAVEYLEKESARTGSNRPALTRLLADARLKKFEVVVVSKIDRFGRSLLEFIENIRSLDSLDIRFVAVDQAIDTDKRNPLAKMLMHLLAMFAEFELDMIHSRTVPGQERYRFLHAAGRVGPGRERQSRSGKNLPVGRPRKSVGAKGQAARLQAAGLSIRAIGRELGVGRSSVHRALHQET